MRHDLLFARAALVAVALAGFAGFGVPSCQSIAGIEQRVLGPCGEYCDVVMSACTGDNAAYASYEACLGTCRLLPAGSSVEPGGSNSVACRLSEARSALLAEPDVHCVGAGPTGGTNCRDLDDDSSVGCESYCMLYERACGSKWYRYGSLAQCAATCGALRDRGTFDAIHDHDGDTLQCRLVHVSAASVEPDTHCEHAALAPPIAPCTEPADATPSCEHYCKVVTRACQGEHAQYEDAPSSPKQCLATCQALDAGTNADTHENTIGCRTYHAYNSLLAPAAHCAHAGPTGDGHCGDTRGLCEAYCRIVDRACHDAALAAFPADSCAAACEALPDAKADSHFSTAKGQVAGATLSCRMLHTLRALGGDSAACAAAVGTELCR